jgi:GGDEF domain-containing protein
VGDNDVADAPASPEPAPRPAASAPTPAMYPDTGLFNEQYFDVMVDTRVSAAKRHLRPVSLVLVVVGLQANGRIVPADRLVVAKAVRRTLREADIACELDGRLGFILEDTPEEGAIWTLERLRRALTEVDGRLVQWAGVACYPAHAFNAAEVLAKAEAALAVARDWPQARIEVASAS